MNPIRVFCWFVLLAFFVDADVRGTGQIQFDVDRVDPPEMSLTTTGLGIGITSAQANLHVAGNAIITGNLGVGGASSSSNLNLNGTMAYGALTLSDNTTLNDNSLALVDTQSGNIVLHLPSPSTCTGRLVFVKKLYNSNKVFVKVSGNGEIDSDRILAMGASSPLPALELICDGTKWYKLSSVGNIMAASSDNLELYYSFDHTSGSLLSDSSLNGINATLVGKSDSDWVPGVIGQALDFNTTDWVNNNYAYSSSNVIPHMDGATKATFSFWAMGSVNTLVSKSIFGFASDLGVTGNVIFQTRWDSPSLIGYQNLGLRGNESLAAFSTTEWGHYVLTSDGSNVYLYYNGILQSTKSVTGALKADGRLYIGKTSADGDASFKGKIDELRLYSRYLEPDEVQLLYLMGGNY